MARTDQLLDVLFNRQQSQLPSRATTGCLPISLQLPLFFFISPSTISVLLSCCYLVPRPVTQLSLPVFHFISVFFISV